MTDECPHGGDPYSCPPCQSPPTGRKARSNDPAGPVTAAAFDGECPGCPFGIEVGQHIRVYRDRWWHARCVDRTRR